MAFLSKMWVHLMMIRIDKKSSKSYENAVNFAIFPVLQPARARASRVNQLSPKIKLESVLYLMFTSLKTPNE